VNPAIRTQAVAFAGVCQSAWLVHRTANGSATSARDVDPLIRSIFATDPMTIEEVYGSGMSLQLGISTAMQLLGRPSPEVLPILKYVMSLLDIEARLRKRADLTQELRSGIEHLHAGPHPDTAEVFAPLSSLYQTTISRLDRRIHVVGSPDVLQRNEVAAKIRALLLAGVRSAWLWHQSGGRRWHLVLRRSTMRSALQALVKPTMIH
jgi:high frequency lysogenization protein